VPLGCLLQSFICIRDRSFPAQKIPRIMKGMSNGRSPSTTPANFQSFPSAKLSVPIFFLANTYVPY
jgi:hypothetical protein